MITRTLIPTLLQKCDPCDILPPAPAQFADSSPEEMNKVSDSKIVKKSRCFYQKTFKHQRDIYQSKTTIVTGFRECGGGEGGYEDDKVLSSKTLRRRERGLGGQQIEEE